MLEKRNGINLPRIPGINPVIIDAHARACVCVCVCECVTRQFISFPGYGVARIAGIAGHHGAPRASRASRVPNCRQARESGRPRTG